MNDPHGASNTDCPTETACVQSLGERTRTALASEHKPDLLREQAARTAKARLTDHLQATPLTDATTS